MAAQRNNFKNRQRSAPYFSNTWKGKKLNQTQHNKQPPFISKEEETFPTQQQDTSPNFQHDQGGTFDGSRDFPKDREPIGHHVNQPNNVRREKKFATRARVYVGNLPRNMTEDELMSLFKPYGEITQVYLEKEKNFGFARMAYRDQAVRAIAALNRSEVKGREIRVRFAASSCSIKVSNLHPMVSNELLYDAFGIFGEVEYAIVVTDERGRSLGHGFIDFAKKSQAVSAIERCAHGCFFLTKSPIPVTVTELTRENNDEGLPDTEISKSSSYDYEREIPPRMAHHGNPEFDFGIRFKGLYEEEKKLRDDLEARLKDMRDQLMAEMEKFKHFEHVNVIRHQLDEHQKAHAMLQQQLHRHEQYLKAPAPHPPSQLMPGVPPPHMLPPPPPHMMPRPPGGMMGGRPPNMGPPQPLLDGNTRGGHHRPIVNSLMSGGPPSRPSLPPYLLPSPAQQPPS